MEKKFDESFEWGEELNGMIGRKGAFGSGQGPGTDLRRGGRKMIGPGHVGIKKSDECC